VARAVADAHRLAVLEAKERFDRKVEQTAGVVFVGTVLSVMLVGVVLAFLTVVIDTI
jgi:hypothetical protein